MRRTYEVLAERDGSWWIIEVPELRGIFSQARRLSQVESMARDAIALFLDVAPDSFDLVVREKLDPEVERIIADAIQARVDAAARQRVATTKSREAVRTLERLGLPQRDIGRLLGLSHQRVAQLRSSAREG
jgi:predicted RNase H-like HicB family nuclease